MFYVIFTGNSIRQLSLLLLEIQDLIITPIYFFIIWLIARLIRSRMPEGSIEKKYFVPGLMVKLLGAIGIGVLYKFYYGFGDTLTYYNAGLALAEVFWQNPLLYFRGLFAEHETFQGLLPKIASEQWYLAIDSTLPISKICSVFYLLSFGSYFSMAMMFAVLSYTGVWALFKLFIWLYPHLSKEMAIACLFIPSVFFWGSGILKDSMTIAAVGWIIYSTYQIFVRKKQFIFSLLMILFWGNLLAIAKLYILAALLPPLLLWIVLLSRERIQNPIRKFLTGPFLLLIAALILIATANSIAQKLQEVAINNIIEYAITAAKWNATGYSNSSSSAYEIDISELDPSNPATLLSILPETVILTLYRPFIWEANKAVILLAAVENLVFLFFSIRLFLKRNPFRVFRSILNDPNLIFFFAFTIGFSFAMGLSSGVFGALVRYKIPMLPLFVATLFILYDSSRPTSTPKSLS